MAAGTGLKIWAELVASGAKYEIRVRGRVSPALLDSFQGMASELEPVETIIHGPVRDWAAASRTSSTRAVASRSRAPRA